MGFEKLLSEFRDVNPSGEAPHKPLLLLTALKAAERDGDLPDVLALSPELAYQFRQFEHIVAHRWKQKLDIRIITVDRSMIVDAAHIAPFRSSRNNIGFEHIKQRIFSIQRKRQCK